MSCNGEAQAGAAGLPGARLVDPVEALEDAVEVFGGDAGAEVADAELDGAAGAKGAAGVRYLAGAHQDSAVRLVAGLAVLDAIFDEVAEDLEDGVGVGDDLGGGGLAGLEDRLGGLEQCAHRLDGIPGEGVGGGGGPGGGPARGAGRVR